MHLDFGFLGWRLLLSLAPDQPEPAEQHDHTGGSFDPAPLADGYYEEPDDFGLRGG